MRTPARLPSPELPVGGNDEIELQEYHKDVESAPFLPDTTIEENSGSIEQEWTPGSHPPNFIWIQIGLTNPPFT